MTLHAQAFVPTSDASEYGERLSRTLADRYASEWGAEAGRVAMSDAACEFHSWPDGLRMDAFAEDEPALARIEKLISTTLEGIARGATPAIEWYRRPSA
jgi:hypothetical protein